MDVAACQFVRWLPNDKLIIDICIYARMRCVFLIYLNNERIHSIYDNDICRSNIHIYNIVRFGPYTFP
jgi:hypothetical protein